MLTVLTPCPNVPLIKPVPFPAPHPTPSAATSEYSETEITSDDPDPSSGVPIFDPEYQPLIFFNAERTEAQFKAASGHVRPLKNAHRTKVMAWLFRVSDKMGFQDETLLLSAVLFDRVAALKRIPLREIQLHAATCLWLASKIEEKLTPFLSDFTYLCGAIYSASDFVECEAKILSLLHFSVSSTTPIIYVQGAVDAESEVAELARFFCYALMFRPSYGAMSASVMGTTAIVLACLIRGEKVRIVKQSVDAVLACTQQLILALQDVGGSPENPVQDALPEWLDGRGISEVKDQIVEFTKSGAIRRFCCSQ
jgi:hypothetical protein